MKKFIIFSIILGVIGSTGFSVKGSTTDVNKNVQYEVAAKAPAKYSTNIIWFMG